MTAKTINENNLDVWEHIDQLFHFKPMTQVANETGLNMATISRLRYEMDMPPDLKVLLKVLASLCWSQEQILCGLKVYGYNPESENRVLKIYLEAALKVCSQHYDVSIKEAFDGAAEEVAELRHSFQVAAKYHQQKKLEIKSRLENYNNSCSKENTKLKLCIFYRSDASQIGLVYLVAFIINNLLSKEEAYAMFDELRGFDLNLCSKYRRLVEVKKIIDQYASVFPDIKIRKDRDLYTEESELKKLLNI